MRVSTKTIIWIVSGIIILVFAFILRQFFVSPWASSLLTSPPTIEQSETEQGKAERQIDSYTPDILSTRTEPYCIVDTIKYDIGTFDPAFGISRESFALAIIEAEKIWESAVESDIFIPSLSGERMKINLIFDDRQAKTFALRQRLAGVRSAEEQYRITNNEYQRLIQQATPMSQEISVLQNAYSLKRDILATEVRAHNERVKIYDNEVVYWNNRGGAPPSKYEQLMRERDEMNIIHQQIQAKQRELKTLGDNLNNKTVVYNELVGQINTIAGILNRLADSLNHDIGLHNRLVHDRGEFITGSYTSNGEEIINIYQFYDHRELVIIIAHELGHALGLSHAFQKNSIMYSMVANQELKLSDEDRILLQRICR